MNVEVTSDGFGLGPVFLCQLLVLGPGNTLLINAREKLTGGSMRRNPCVVRFNPHFGCSDDHLVDECLKMQRVVATPCCCQDVGP